MAVQSAEVYVKTGTIGHHTVADVRVELPQAATIDSVVGQAKNKPSDPFGSCARGGECAVGWCQFDGDPSISDEPGRRVVTWRFENWSHDWDRIAKVEVTYH